MKSDKKECDLFLKETLERCTEGINTSRQRAEEIAHLDEITLDEFRELTGIGEADYGIFHIASAGIDVGCGISSRDLSALQQKDLRDAQKKLSLKFPCPLEEFADWYKKTCSNRTLPDGKQVLVSDFELAPGFLSELEKRGTWKGVANREFATRHQIIEVFKVKQNDAENEKWWDKKLRDPNNSSGLVDCRVQSGKRGRGGVPSLWDPYKIACWLITKKHLGKSEVISSFKVSFPAMEQLCEGLESL